MHPNIRKINNAINALKQNIITHKIYKDIDGIDDLRIFMQYHIYAVWDFMSLLKALQVNLTCISLPWFPKGDPYTRKLINEIVAGEESDTDRNGDIKSHFEMYLDAMEQCGADTKPVYTFLGSLQNGKTLEEAFEIANVPAAAQNFLSFTFEIINSRHSHLQAAAFTFGREDLIPGMFISMVADLNNSTPDKISDFKYYLERHIEVDGDHHSHLALQMVEKICGNDPVLWQEAEQAAKQSLLQRQYLWDAALEEIMYARSLAMQS